MVPARILNVTGRNQAHVPHAHSRGFGIAPNVPLSRYKVYKQEIHDSTPSNHLYTPWRVRHRTRGNTWVASYSSDNQTLAKPTTVTTLLESRSIPDVALAKQLGVSEEFFNALMELPGTKSVSDMRDRLLALSHWQGSLKKGILPAANSIDWPAEPFRSKFLSVMKRLEMPRFTRRYPKLLGSLLRQLLELAKEFEDQLEEEENKKRQQQNQSGQGQSSMSQTQDQESGESSGEQSASGEQMSSAQNESSTLDGQESEGGEVVSADTEVEPGDADVELQLDSGQGGDNSMAEASTMEEDSSSEGQGDFAEQLAEEMLKKLEEKWSPMMEALETAALTFEDIDGLLDGPTGFDSSSALWHQTGWREVAALRKKLEDLRELRELVRSLGRGSGKGPLRRAPEQVFSSNNPPGVIRSEQCPEETRGLTRSGDLSRMLPMEAHLLAAGWPRRRGQPGVEFRSTLSTDKEDVDGSRACRLLFMARRAERQLMSYERTGWSEGEPSKLTGRLEIRPAAELGPIVVCLDTSGKKEYIKFCKLKKTKHMIACHRSHKFDWLALLQFRITFNFFAM